MQAQPRFKIQFKIQYFIAMSTELIGICFSAALKTYIEHTYKQTTRVGMHTKKYKSTKIDSIHEYKIYINKNNK